VIVEGDPLISIPGQRREIAVPENQANGRAQHKQNWLDDQIIKFVAFVLASSLQERVETIGLIYKWGNYGVNFSKNNVRYVQYIATVRQEVRQSIDSGLGFWGISTASLAISSYAEAYYFAELRAHFAKRQQIIENMAKCLSYYNVNAKGDIVFDDKVAKKDLDEEILLKVAEFREKIRFWQKIFKHVCDIAFSRE